MDDELNSPFAVILSKEYSTMLVAETRHNRILQYSSDFSTFTMIHGSSDPNVQIYGPMAIALTDDGNDLINACYQDQRVRSWSLRNHTSSLVSYAPDFGQNPTRLAVDRNKKIYSVQSGAVTVARYGLNVSSFPSSEEWSLHNIDSEKHAIIMNDSIYVAQSRLCRVIKVSLLDTYRKILVVAGNGRIGSKSDRLRFPWGVAVDFIEGHIFVSDTGNHRVQLCKSDFYFSLLFAPLSFSAVKCYRRRHDRRC